MQLFAVILALGLASADKLDNTYGAPLSARTAGGNGNFLQAPSSRGSSSRGGAPGSDHNAEAAAIATLRLNNDVNVGDGSYKFDFETENQIKHEEQGELRNAGSDQETTVVRGSYSYVGPDGVTYTVNYIADENGFQATGDHLPVAPEVPQVSGHSQGSVSSSSNKYSNNNRNNNYNNNNNNQGGFQGYPSGGPSNAPRPFSPTTNSREYLPPKPSNQQSGYKY